MQARHEQPPPGEPTPPWIWLAATFVMVALTFGGLYALTRPSGGDGETTADTSADGQVTGDASVSSSTTAPVVVNASPTSERASAALIPWVGSFIWTEIERRSDGDRAAAHRLDLTNLSADGDIITGRLQQTGLSAPVDITVTAQLIDGVVTVLASSGSPSTYVDREVLFRLTGDPAAPTTDLGGLQTLLSPASEGAYFGPGAGGTTAVGDPGTVTTTTSDPSTTTSETTSTTATTVPTTTTAPTLDRWLGGYTWTEFVGGGASSDQTLIHQLQLTGVSADGNRLLGRLTQNGFQTANNVAVAAEPSGGDVLIRVVQVDSVPPAYTAGEVLFLLAGDPVNPITTVHELDVLQVGLIPSGSYFTP